MLPLLAGVLGSGIGSAALEAIGHAIAGSPTEAEARQRVAPLFYNEVAKLMAQGVSMPDAEKQANEAVSGHIKDEMSKSNLPDWAGGMLGVVGGIGGWAAGAKLAGKGLARMASKAVAGEAGAGAAKAASLADAAIEDPAKKIAAGAVAEGSGKAAEGAAKVTPMFPKKFTPAQEGGMEEMGESAAMNTPMEEIGERISLFPRKAPRSRIVIDQPMGGID